jgi:hypothetical protein
MTKQDDEWCVCLPIFIVASRSCVVVDTKVFIHIQAVVTLWLVSDENTSESLLFSTAFSLYE